MMAFYPASGSTFWTCRNCPGSAWLNYVHRTNNTATNDFMERGTRIHKYAEMLGKRQDAPTCEESDVARRYIADLNSLYPINEWEFEVEVRLSDWVGGTVDALHRRSKTVVDLKTGSAYVDPLCDQLQFYGAILFEGEACTLGVWQDALRLCTAPEPLMRDAWSDVCELNRSRRATLVPGLHCEKCRVRVVRGTAIHGGVCAKWKGEKKEKVDDVI